MRGASPAFGLFHGSTQGAEGQRLSTRADALDYILLESPNGDARDGCAQTNIVREVWGETLADDSRVEKLVSRLRRKIEPVPGRPQHIRTVRGRGYRLLT